MSKIAQYVGNRNKNKNKIVKPYISQGQPYDETQVKNSNGGYVYKVGNWDQLVRFLILGTYGGTYYIKENELTVLNYDVILDCLKEDGVRVVSEILRVSESGLAPKNDFAVFALAVAAAHGDEQTKQLAYEVLPRVCRIATHLFQFLEDSKAFRGRGNGFNRAIRRWYTNKTIDQQAYQMVKYRSRNSWSHRDVLRTIRIKPENVEASALYGWAVTGEWKPGKIEVNVDGHVLSNGFDVAKPKIIEGFEKSQAATSTSELVKVIKQYDLTWEAVPTQYLKDKSVWEALLSNTPPIALMRNLGNMSSAGVFDAGEWDNTKLAIDTLTNVEKLRKNHCHPMQSVIAQITYAHGGGFKGSNTWAVNPKLVDALNDSFYASMQAIVPTGKKFLVGVDESQSMTQASAVSGLNCKEAAAIMALTTYVAEPNCQVIFFDTKYREEDKMSKHMSLNDAKKLARNGGGTNLNLPMQYALDKKIKDIDVFVVFTDNETWEKHRHAQDLFNEYRNTYNANAKLIVCSMVANVYTVGDPKDPATLQTIGLDASLPKVISSFVLA